MSIKCILAEQGGSAVQGSEGTYLLQELEITHAPNKLLYIPGESFDKTGLVVMGTYGIDGVPFNTVDVTNIVLISPDPLTLGTERVKIYMIAGDGTEVAVYYPITVRPVLQSLTYSGTIITEYEYGDTCPGTLPSIATYSDGSSQAVTGTGDFNGAFATIGTKTVTYSYTDSYGDIASYVVNYTVNRKSVVKPSWKGSTPVYSGALIDVGSATYWNNWNSSYWSVDGTTGTSAGSYTANFTLGGSYRWSDRTTNVLSLGWSIDKASITTVPTQSGSLTYNGSSRTPSWNNYNTTQLTIGGTTSGVNARTYTVTFTPTSNYKWSDGSASKNATWTIGKATRSITLDKTSVVLTASNKSATVTATASAGTNSCDWSLSPNYVTGLTAYSINSSGTVSITGNGSTAISSTTITVKLADPKYNYNDTSKTFTLSTNYWSFGAGNGEVADAAWFEGLKNYLASNSGSSLRTSSGGSIVGTTKTITLTTAVLGTTSHLIRVIGVDEDGPNTVTWQTANCLAVVLKWSSRSGDSVDNYDPEAAKWRDSQCLARQYCEAYYAAMPKNAQGQVTYVKTVNKGTCSSTDDSRNSTPTYRDETVFLPSELEMGLDGYSPLSKANSTAIKLEGTYGVDPTKYGYTYYASNDSRIKRLGETGQVMWYWVRSRCYNSNLSYNICDVNVAGWPAYQYYWGTSGMAPAFVVGN